MGQKNLAVTLINEGFFCIRNVWPFCQAAKKSGRNKEVTVRGGSTVSSARCCTNVRIKKHIFH